VRKNLLEEWSINYGGDEILLKLKDPSLALELLEKYLQSGLEYAFSLGKAHSLLNPDTLLKLFVDRARQPGLNKDQIDNLGTSIRFTLLDHKPSPPICHDAINDASLDPFIRLSVLDICEDVPPQALALILDGLTGEEYMGAYIATAAMLKLPQGEKAIIEVLDRKDIPTNRRFEILDFFARSFFKEDILVPDKRLFELISEGSIPSECGLRLKAIGSSFNESLFKELIDDFDTLPFEVVLVTLGLFGHYQSRPLVEESIRQLRKRTFSLRQLFAVGDALERGMTSIFEMNGFFSGRIRYAPPHVGIDLFLSYFEEVVSHLTLEDLDVLRFYEVCATLGSKEASEKLSRGVCEYLEKLGFALKGRDEDTLGNLLYTLLGLRKPLPISIVERIVKQCPRNVSHHAIDMLGAHGTRDAMDCLVSLFHEVPDKRVRSHILEVLEPLAGRFGQSVRRVTTDILTVTSA
jgi:hypothetical protein